MTKRLEEETAVSVSFDQGTPRIRSIPEGRDLAMKKDRFGRSIDPTESEVEAKTLSRVVFPSVPRSA